MAQQRPATETCHSKQPCVPAAERTECLLDHRGAASNTVDRQVDSIVDPILDLDIQELSSLTTGGGDLENFQRLFSKLKEMKDKAATLPHEQRKMHAEKVAKAFWMAIGETEMKLKAFHLRKSTKLFMLGLA